MATLSFDFFHNVLNINLEIYWYSQISTHYFAETLEVPNFLFFFFPSFDKYLLLAVVPNTLPEMKDFTFGLIYSIHKYHKHKHEKSVLSFFRKLL